MKSKDIVADKGFAWLMLIAAIGSNILMSDTFSTSGVFYEEYTERFAVSKALAAWISGLKLLMFAFSAFTCTLLLPFIGARWLVFLCTVVTVSGYISTMYVTNIYAVLISYGIAPGLGLCTVGTIWLQVIATFFQKYRGLAIGLIVGANAVGSTSLPMLLQYLFNEYSWKGALLINSGLHLHNLAFCLMMPSDFGKKTLNTNSKRTKRIRCDTFSGSTTVINEKGKVELVGYSGSRTSLTFSTIKKEDKENVQRKHCMKNDLSAKNGSLNSVVQKPSQEDIAKEKQDIQTEEKGVDRMDASLSKILKNKRVIVHLIGTCLVKYGHISTYAYIPSLGVEIALTKTQASAMVSMMAAVNIVGRPVMGFLSDCGPCRSQKPFIYAFMWALYGALIMLLAWCNTFTYMLVDVILIGVCASYVVPVAASLLADFGGPKAMMLLPPTLSIGLLSGAVLGGLILEVTGTCTWVMMVAGGVQMFGSILLFINCKL